MKYTGERIIPNNGELYSLFKRHLSLYEFASQFTKDKMVLDIGCGEGYGSNLLAKQAQKVIAIDNSPEAIEYASKVYLKDNLEFKIGDATHLDFAKDSFDLIIAIELIEHLKDYRKFLGEVYRTLKTSGTFIVSTPHLRHPSPDHISHSPYHFKEFSLKEFENVLCEYFDVVEILGVNFKGFDLKGLLKKFDIFKFRRLLPSSTRIKIIKKIDKNISYEINKEYVKKSPNLIGICRNPKIFLNSFS